MTWFTKGLITLSVIILSSCSASDLPQPKSPIEVDLNVDITQPEPKSLRVAGNTNLPDGFVMQIFVCRYLVVPDDANSEKLVAGTGTCGGGTYVETKKVEVLEQSFVASFQVPSVEETQKIQATYLDQNPDRKDLLDKVPWNYLSVEVSGFPSHQNQTILDIVGPQANNLTGPDILLRNASKDREAYKIIRWEMKIKH